MLTEVLGGATEDDIEEAPLTMAANDKDIRLKFGGCLYNDAARIALAEDG